MFGSFTTFDVWANEEVDGINVIDVAANAVVANDADVEVVDDVATLENSACDAVTANDAEIVFVGTNVIEVAADDVVENDELTTPVICDPIPVNSPTNDPVNDPVFEVLPALRAKDAVSA
jgi:hypothetical protein